MLKKLFIGLGIILTILILLIIGWLTSVNTASFIGNIQNNNEPKFEVTSPNITYIGDSLTNGFYSSGGLQTGNFGYRSIVDESLQANSNNFAVGGYTSEDVLKQLNNDTTIGEVNSKINEFKGANTTDYPLDDNTTISESIANSDYVIGTIGANDIIMNLLNFNEDGSFSINYDTIIQDLNSIRDRKLEIYTRIHEINPDAQIIDIGIYFAYPHLSDRFMRMLYPILMFAESKIFIDDNDINVHKVTIRDNMQANIKGYIDNPMDIHPNQDGYQIMANEVLREIGKLQA